MRVNIWMGHEAVVGELLVIMLIGKTLTAKGERALSRISDVSSALHAHWK